MTIPAAADEIGGVPELHGDTSHIPAQTLVSPTISDHIFGY